MRQMANSRRRFYSSPLSMLRLAAALVLLWVIAEQIILPSPSQVKGVIGAAEFRLKAREVAKIDRCCAKV